MSFEKEVPEVSKPLPITKKEKKQLKKKKKKKKKKNVFYFIKPQLNIIEPGF